MSNESSPVSTPARKSLAAVDLGSNSFHMIIGREVDGQLHQLDRLREPVRLAAGLQDDGSLDAASRERALACLERFGQRLRHVPESQVRAVGTNTLRQAKNAKGFLDEACVALGHPIEILPGREEARMIYLGVAHTLADDGLRRLVVDIGGGSTECILGERFNPLERDSLYMGCVSFSRRFFSSGKLTKSRFEGAQTAAELEVQPIRERYRGMGWDSAVGASGTINAIADVLRETGLGPEGITLAGMRELRKTLLEAGHIDNIALPGLKEDRAPVIAGGLAILMGVFSQLGVEKMSTSSGALREGLLYDLIGRIRHEDSRDRSVSHLCERYSVDVRQAARVERSALQLFRQIQGAWDLDFETGRRLLVWASQLHEIGLAVSYTGYHKHSAYLIENGDMPGFSRQEQNRLAAVVRGHRRKVPRDIFVQLSESDESMIERLCVIFRVAVLLNRSRAPELVPEPKVHGKPRKIVLELPSEWLEQQPLSRTDLEQEVARLQQGFGVILSINPDDHTH